MRGIIERFEGRTAIVRLNAGEIVNVEVVRLPEGAEEGMVINFSDHGIEIDYKETAKIKNDKTAE